MRYLSLSEVLWLQQQLITNTGGAHGLRDLSALESAVAQPRMTYEGEDLYPGLFEKVAALGFSLINNHPFVDGNKRVGHAAMATMLALNGYEIEGEVDEHEAIILGVARGDVSRAELREWISEKAQQLSD
jgi:death-on-curing protein